MRWQMGDYGRGAGRVAAAVLAGLAGWGMAGSAGASSAWGAVSAVGSRGRAAGAAGLGELGAPGTGVVYSVSCGSPGNCAAGGTLVAVERNGRWGKATRLRGLGGFVLSVSCVPAGYCAAGGRSSDRSAPDDGFVAVERNGRWGKAFRVPGLAALNTEGYGWVTSVSCGAAGSCAAGGFYGDSGGGRQGFVAVELNGRWGKATRLPGLAELNKDGFAEVTSVSCGATGSCAAGGFYGGGFQQGFVAVERHGRWGKAIVVPGLAELNTAGDAQVSSVACGAAGRCAAGGNYLDRRSHDHPFVALERHGRWGKATRVPGLGALNKGGSARVLSVSCAPAGGCAAGGYYTDRHGSQQGFAVAERNGRWGKAAYVPGLPALNKGGSAAVGSLSCASPGNCAAGGVYTDSHALHGGERSQQGFAVLERHGRWGKATGIPGLGALNKGSSAGVDSVSCASASNCAAGGFYAENLPPPGGAASQQAFVAVENNGRWGKAIEMRPGN